MHVSVSYSEIKLMHKVFLRQKTLPGMNVNQVLQLVRPHTAPQVVVAPWGAVMVAVHGLGVQVRAAASASKAPLAPHVYVAEPGEYRDSSQVRVQGS